MEKRSIPIWLLGLATAPNLLRSTEVNTQYKSTDLELQQLLSWHRQRTLHPKAMPFFASRKMKEKGRTSKHLRTTGGISNLFFTACLFHSDTENIISTTQSFTFLHVHKHRIKLQLTSETSQACAKDTQMYLWHLSGAESSTYHCNDSCTKYWLRRLASYKIGEKKNNCWLKAQV